MKYYISQETGSVLAFQDKELCFTPIDANNTFDSENFWPVDEAATEGELVTGYDTERRTLGDVYREARKALIEGDK